MSLKGAATIVVVGAALAALATAATSSLREPPTNAPPVRSAAVDLRGAELANEIARLHDRLRPDAAPRPGRNLFQFAAATRRSGPMVERPALTEPAPASVPTPVETPAFKLVGVAEDTGSSGPERTAIITGLGQLFLVKEGENVTLRYRVAKISADVVELTDLAGGPALRIAMK